MSPLSSDELQQIRESITPAGGSHAITPAEISEKTRVAWPILLVLLGAVSTAAVAIAQARDAGAEVATHAAKIQTLEVQAAKTDLSLEFVKVQLAEQNRKLDQVLDRMKK